MARYIIVSDKAGKWRGNVYSRTEARTEARNTVVGDDNRFFLHTIKDDATQFYKVYQYQTKDDFLEKTKNGDPTTIVYNAADKITYMSMTNENEQLCSKVHNTYNDATIFAEHIMGKLNNSSMVEAIANNNLYTIKEYTTKDAFLSARPFKANSPSAEADKTIV